MDTNIEMSEKGAILSEWFYEEQMLHNLYTMGMQMLADTAMDINTDHG